MKQKWQDLQDLIQSRVGGGMVFCDTTAVVDGYRFTWTVGKSVMGVDITRDTLDKGIPTEMADRITEQWETIMREQHLEPHCGQCLKELDLAMVEDAMCHDCNSPICQSCWPTHTDPGVKAMRNGH